MPSSYTSRERILVMTALILAGEVIFTLPFVVARIFRPTVLDAFGITNFQLGTAFSLYGVVAMLTYFPGGPLADLFPARRLLAASMVTTALGGAVYATIPPLGVLRWLFAFWGLTTILLFWAALIRATREWGGTTSQGRAYGILDGGRGLVAALLASLTVAVFGALLPSDAATATLEQRSAALSQVIWIFTGFTLVVAVLVWLWVPEQPTNRDPAGAGDTSKPAKATLEGVRRVLAIPAVWLQAGIVICAYVAYKSVDDFSLFARDAFGMDDVAAAQVGTLSFWVRPFAAIGAGFLGDRIGSSKVIVISFGVLAIGSLAMSASALQPSLAWLLMITVAGTSVAIHGLRGVYFAIFGEAKVPLAFTGSAVGLVSVLGYTPDIFMGPLMGYLVDRSPGAAGHQHFFLVVAGFAVVGLLTALLFRRACAARS